MLRFLGRICFKIHLGCWKNLVPCKRRTKVPVSLLAISQEALTTPKDYSTALHMSSSIFSHDPLNPSSTSYF